MGDPVTLAVGGSLVAGSLVESRNARREERRAARIQERSNRLRASRQAVEQVRQAQIARAEIIAAGEQGGVGSSSAVIGGAGSVQSQAGGNIAFQQQLFSLQAQASRRLERASQSRFNAQALGQLSGLAASAFSSTPAAAPGSGQSASSLATNGFSAGLAGSLFGGNS